MVIGEWEYYHSTRLDKLVRMVVFPFSYDHWRPRYSTKRYQIGLFITFGTASFDVSLNISASSVWNTTIWTSSSRWVEWWYSHSFTTTGRRDIWLNVIKSASLSLSVLRHLTFRRISRRPVVVEEWKYHHSTRLVKRHKIGNFIPAPFEYLGIQWL